MSSVNKSDLKNAASTAAGKVTGYDVDLNAIHATADKKEALVALGYDIRALLRSQQNLEEAIIVVEQFDMIYPALKHKVGYDETLRGLFSLAVILYGACFVKGGGLRKIPLEKIDTSATEGTVTHKAVMQYRHKLLSHLDDDHEVREDRLNWLLTVEGSSLIPRVPRLGSTKTLFVMGDENQNWIGQMKFLKKQIEIKVKELTVEVNALLGSTVSIRDS